MKAIGEKAREFWERLNALAELVQKDRINAVSYPLLMTKSAAGFTLSIAPGHKILIRAKVKEIDDDWLRCYFFPHDSMDAVNLYVRKPIDLMRMDLATSADKADFTWVDEQTRTEDGDTHTVWPPYVVDGEITIGLQVGGTGLEDPDENPIIFVDMNIDARTWTLEC
jgi:hypothetical protein